MGGQSAWKMATAVLSLMVLASALSVVYVKHQSRQLFIQLQGLNSQRDELEVPGRLQQQCGPCD